MKEKQPVYLRFEDAVRSFDIKPTLLARAVDQGLIRAVKLGEEIVVSREDTENLARSPEVVGEAALPVYVPFEESLRRFAVDGETLRQAVERGEVKAITIDGTLAVAEEDVRVLSIRVNLWRQVRHLEGVPIGVRDAYQKYGLSPTTLYRWIESGYIRVMKETTGKGRGKKRILNEADVAYADLLRRRLGGRKGKRFFNEELVPPRSEN